jgi:hypothetical protein
MLTRPGHRRRPRPRCSPPASTRSCASQPDAWCAASRSTPSTLPLLARVGGELSTATGDELHVRYRVTRIMGLLQGAASTEASCRSSPSTTPSTGRRRLVHRTGHHHERALGPALNRKWRWGSRGLGERFEGDLVAEALELADEAAAVALGVLGVAAVNAGDRVQQFELAGERGVSSSMRSDSVTMVSSRKSIWASIWPISSA